MESRPYVICHMLSTIDGRITFGTINGKDVGVPLFTDYMNLYNQIHEKLGTTAWMCGRVTMAEFTSETNTSLNSYEDELSEDDFINSSDLTHFAITIDTKGSLRWNDNKITLSSTELSQHNYHLITIVTKSTPKKYLTYLKNKGISYVFAGEDKISFSKALEKLKEKFNIERLLLEGGGNINGSVLLAELIDELSILYVPVVINNVEAPALFYNQLDMPKIHNFKLKGVEQLERDVLWIRYTKAE